MREPVSIRRDPRGVATVSINNAAKANRLDMETMQAFEIGRAHV